ncbi:hypothetical protein ASPVEDRAFT_871257 [Aspergillus versicolor CBS 583.65]|uniref:Uncharacterized protein n=1 Tax=Aspergillus versicolor CBS 583.65 TaxID=1036611 RepID=A0A1L9P2T1_ASPVE|nr:uncharacterized protein ASPVEDRAFT_871257 [Aspergillus versicolor CBS 583.65]OJI95837.1 hypothetical protein ASPVEDRAFT_871257 [Aspergillus versicolor CBS 583.65]
MPERENMINSDAENMREAARIVAAIDADLNTATNKSSAHKMEATMQEHSRNVAAIEAHLKNTSNKRPAVTMNPTEQERRLKIRKILCKAHNATRPRNLFETLVVDRITGCPLTGKHMSVKEACALVKEQWVKEGIWDPKWSKHGIPFGPWKAMEYMNPPGFWEWATMERQPIPNGPFHRFQTHLSMLQQSIYKEKGEIPPDDVLATRVRMAWKYWNIWNRNWGAAPGQEAKWNHEIPLEAWLKDEMGDEYIYDPDTAVEEYHEAPLPAWFALAKKDPSNVDAAGASTLPSLPFIERDCSGEPLYGIDRITKTKTSGINRAAFGKRQGPSIFGSIDSPYQFNRIRLPNWEGWPLYQCCLKCSPHRSSRSAGAKLLACGPCIHHTNYDPNTAIADSYTLEMSNTPRRAPGGLSFSGLISPYMDWAALENPQDFVGNPAVWAGEGRRAATRRRLAQQEADKRRGDPVGTGNTAPTNSHWQRGLPGLAQDDIGQLPPTVAVPNFQPYGAINANSFDAQQWLQPYIDQQTDALQGYSYPRCQKVRRQYQLNSLATGRNWLQPLAYPTPMTTQHTIPPLNTRPASLVNTDYHQRAAQDDKLKLPPRTRFMHSYPGNLNPRATAFQAPAQPSDPVSKSEKNTDGNKNKRDRAADTGRAKLKGLDDKDRSQRAPAPKTVVTTVRVDGGTATLDIGGRINPKTAKTINLLREGVVLIWSRSPENPDDLRIRVKISRPQVSDQDKGATQNKGTAEGAATEGTTTHGTSEQKKTNGEPGVTDEKGTVDEGGIASKKGTTGEGTAHDATTDEATVDEEHATDEKATAEPAEDWDML